MFQSSLPSSQLVGQDQLHVPHRENAPVEPSTRMEPVRNEHELKSFDEFLARRFPESRRKVYYLMSIYENLPPQASRGGFCC